MPIKDGVMGNIHIEYYKFDSMTSDPGSWEIRINGSILNMASEIASAPTESEAIEKSKKLIDQWRAEGIEVSLTERNYTLEIYLPIYPECDLTALHRATKELYGGKILTREQRDHFRQYAKTLPLCEGCHADMRHRKSYPYVRHFRTESKIYNYCASCRDGANDADRKFYYTIYYGH